MNDLLPVDTEVNIANANSLLDLLLAVAGCPGQVSC